MPFTWDPIRIVNAVLCITILILGYWGYKKKGDKVAPSIGIAFGLFGISHIMVLAGLKETLTNVLIIIRVLAYLTVVFTLCKLVAKR